MIQCNRKQQYFLQKEQPAELIFKPSYNESSEVR